MRTFFRESEFLDWWAYGPTQSVGRRETLKGLAVPDLTQPTLFVTQDTFFALGMGCASPYMEVKVPVSRQPLLDPPSMSLEEYEATRYRLLKDVLIADLVDALVALDLEGEEKWEDILLRGDNQGAGRRQTARGTLDKWLPPVLRMRLLHILADLFALLTNLEDREPRLVEWKEAP